MGWTGSYSARERHSPGRLRTCSLCVTWRSANVHRAATRPSQPGAAADTGGRDSHRVLQLTTLLRRLGPAGAVANVRAVLDDRQREDWLVQGLADRLAPAP